MSLALVTGATSGLGLALCCLLAEKKIPFIATGRDIDRLASLPALKTLPLDLSKDREPLLHLIRKHAPDLVINNAGYTFYGPALQYSTPQQMDTRRVINGIRSMELCGRRHGQHWNGRKMC